MPELSHYLPITDPTLIFFVVLCIILLAPIIMGKLRIPHIVGMVLAGMLIGKYGLNILERDSSFELFGEVGLYYIMFLAGLEIDMNGLKNNSWKVVGFGLLTFAVPFVLVFLSCLYMLHYSAVASLLLGSVLGSNTLIAYPIVCKYGLQKHNSVTLCVGASMISVTFALVVLAAIVGTYNNGTGIGFWLLFILKFAAYIGAAVYCIPRITRWFLRRYSDAVMQYIFIMGILFLSAAITDMLGMEGVFGAFFAGLMLNRYIPHVSPLMNRIEFIGNALFIPYFLIGVGMLINVRVLFEGWSTAFITFCLVFFGTVGKALAAYAIAFFHRLPKVHGHMMFGLTAAHAAGSIAIVMVGIRLKVAEGTYLLNDDMLNGVVMMILFTCIIGSMVTEKASRDIVLNDIPTSANDSNGDDEKILIPVKYPETAETLVNMAILMRNPKLNRGLVGLNVVYDDENRLQGQEKGKSLLEKLANMAIAADVRMLTQVRIATNIANGIKHAFKEFNASEIIMGLHNHKNVSKRFWGEFIQSLFNGLNRQIVIVQCNQPLNTIRRIHVAVPSRAEFEPGFCRWMERVARMAGNLDCKIEFHGQQGSLSLIRDYIQNRHPNLRAEYTLMAHWIELPALAASIREDHMFVVVTARKGTVSYKLALEQLPEELTRHFSGKSLMIIYPDQYGEQADAMTFAAPQHQEEQSAYNLLMAWIRKKLLNKK
ncbi:MAG: cation:proton antiporter [Bacteroidales bacterium]|nr:cation:proton antiporter [Bacteroidales bacterium]MDD6897503.1 cation:proton antiporter [Bacteroidales bacterium]MDY4731940.1 cation:proton antiporter [Prevotella sp.]MDY6028618.1 cation:proton antiporter [Prevotella sp.]